jgi:hypothetical protein
MAMPWAYPLFDVWERLPLLRHLTQNIVVLGIKSAHGMGDPDFFAYKLPAMLDRIQSGLVSQPPQ